jgi:valyl-tRNA synthetase
VLDTWFSSALWPFATLGWPDDTEDLRTYFPTQVDSTARDIINLWVARMMVTSLRFLGTEPFSDVIIHSTILAADGRRMSKSLGTGTDPLDLIDAHGADAVRYGLLKMSSTQDVRFAAGAIEEGRGLCNKLWNAARLILLRTEPVAPEPAASEPVDAWILARLDRAVEEFTALVDAYELSAAAKALYRFVFDDLCDWYLEAAKLRLDSDDEAVRRGVSATLLYVLDRTLRLSHPILPHLTEELWSYAGGEGLLIRTAWPPAGEAPRDERAEAAVAAAFDLVVELRRLRADAELKPREPLVVTLEGANGAASAAPLVAGLGHAQVEHDGADAGGIPIAVAGLTAHVRGAGLAESLRPRLEQRLGTARSELERARRKLGDERFTGRAPAELVEAEREKAERYGREAEELERRLHALG